jgi:cytochrome c551/c552
LSSLPATAGPDGAQVFVQQGCVNCHHAQARSAPTFKHLSEHLAKHGDQPESLQHMLKEVREHRHVHTHQMVSDAAALTVLKWLAQGGR